jgi:hypothetical protein
LVGVAVVKIWVAIVYFRVNLIQTKCQAKAGEQKLQQNHFTTAILQSKHPFTESTTLGMFQPIQPSQMLFCTPPNVSIQFKIVKLVMTRFVQIIIT